MSGRGRPRQFDRRAALRTAMLLFWEHGYAGTSMSMLTASMGITSTSLYAAFGSKDELFREAIRLYDSPDSSPTERGLREPSARGAVEAALRGNADAYVDPDTPPGCMVVLAGLNLGSGQEHIGRFLAQNRREVRARISARIQRGVDEGDLPASSDRDALAAYVTTVMHGLSILARDGCGRDEAHQVVDSAMVGWDALIRQYEEGTVAARQPAE
ncbi:TetR/AcrR family transcriptional regulator [Spiractinospora alimapuensis]|uniref:TetR/AcrR family transcriptional regulator n=1 Tax=Spiractinospora alimapuensis TaxID=2820884 RepID=UPI001F1E3E03|nr:TetR/AcrR family transcriptional regulator [Spiractinospora alimapuensis]QVQ49990.1 TetR/AcrR family transcriptional regulator [Spiractinospora alimapuensis]